MSIVNFNSSRRAHTEGTPLQINSSLDPKWVLLSSGATKRTSNS